MIVEMILIGRLFYFEHIEGVVLVFMASIDVAIFKERSDLGKIIEVL